MVACCRWSAPSPEGYEEIAEDGLIENERMMLLESEFRPDRIAFTNGATGNVKLLAIVFGQVTSEGNPSFRLESVC